MVGVASASRQAWALNEVQGHLHAHLLWDTDVDPLFAWPAADCRYLVLWGDAVRHAGGRLPIRAARGQA